MDEKRMKALQGDRCSYELPLQYMWAFRERSKKLSGALGRMCRAFKLSLKGQIKAREEGIKIFHLKKLRGVNEHVLRVAGDLIITGVGGADTSMSLEVEFCESQEVGSR